MSSDNKRIDSLYGDFIKYQRGVIIMLIALFALISFQKPLIISAAAVFIFVLLCILMLVKGLKQVKHIALRAEELGEEIEELKKTEKELKESEERCRRFVDGSEEIFYSFSREKGGVYDHDKVKKILGYDAEELKEDPFLWYNAVHPADKDKVNRSVAMFYKGKNYKIKYRIKHKNGEWRWFYDRSIEMRKIDGDMVVDGLAMDITEAKTAEEKFGNFSNLTSDIFCITDKNGVIIQINPAVEKILGYKVEEFISKPYMDYVHPEDKNFSKEYMEMPSKHMSFTNRYICYDGSVKWLKWTAHRYDDQDVTFAVAVDCTERLEQEDALKESELWMKNIFDTLKETVIVISPLKDIVFINNACKKMFGYTEKEFREQSTRILHVDQEHFEEYGRKMEKAFAKNESAEFEFKVKRKNGNVFPSEHTVSLLKDGLGIPIGIINVIRDISDKKKLEKQLEKMSKQQEQSKM